VIELIQFTVAVNVEVPIKKQVPHHLRKRQVDQSVVEDTPRHEVADHLELLADLLERIGSILLQRHWKQSIVLCFAPESFVSVQCFSEQVVELESGAETRSLLIFEHDFQDCFLLECWHKVFSLFNDISAPLNRVLLLLWGSLFVSPVVSHKDRPSVLVIPQALLHVEVSPVRIDPENVNQSQIKQLGLVGEQETALVQYRPQCEVHLHASLIELGRVTYQLLKIAVQLRVVEA